MITGRPISMHFATYIAHSYCYVIVIPTDRNQKCRDLSFVYAQVEGLHLGIQDRRARIRGRGGWGCVGADAGASAGNSSGTTIGGWSPALPFFPGKKTDRRGGAAVVRCVLGRLAVAWRPWQRTWTWTNEEWILVMRYIKRKQFRITPRHSVDGTARNFWNFSCSSCQTKYQSSNLQIKLNYDGLLQVRLAYSSLSCTECF